MLLKVKKFPQNKNKIMVKNNNKIKVYKNQGIQ